MHPQQFFAKKTCILKMYVFVTPLVQREPKTVTFLPLTLAVVPYFINAFYLSHTSNLISYLTVWSLFNNSPSLFQMILGKNQHGGNSLLLVMTILATTSAFSISSLPQFNGENTYFP